MPLKLCYNKEIHKVANVPSSLQALRDLINSIYLQKLPNNYRIEYTDNEGDRIQISNDDEYQYLIQSELKAINKSIKVYIYPFDKKPKNKSTSTDEAKIKPPLIENTNEFAEDLALVGERMNDQRLEEEAPSDESIPSSEDDNMDKIPIIKEVMQEIQRDGVVDMKADTLRDSESDQEAKSIKDYMQKSGQHSMLIEEDHMVKQVFFDVVKSNVIFLDGKCPLRQEKI